MFLGSTGNDLCFVSCSSHHSVFGNQGEGPWTIPLSGLPLSRELLAKQVRLALKSEGIDEI